MVSVVLPAYKAIYLESSIRSILQQSFTDIELIIVNDASPEDLKSIVSSFNDTRIRYYENEINIGGENLVKNWNKCLEYATGEFVVLASDDDIYHPNFLREMVKLAKKYPTLDLFHCRVGIINEKDEPIYWGASIAEYESDIDFIFQRAIMRRVQLVSDFMIRREALKKINGFIDYPKAWYSDEMTMYLLARNKGVVCAQETLFYWRSSLVNISSSITDTLQKAEASYLYEKDMDLLIRELIPNNEKDIYYLAVLQKKIHGAIGQQLCYDLVKTKFSTLIKIIRNKRYRDLLSKKQYIELVLRRML